MRVVGEPACTEEKDRECRCGCGDHGASEAGGDGLHRTNDPASSRCGERVGEEIASVGAEKMRHAACGVWGEDWEANGTFDEIEDHRGEASDRAKHQADQDDSEVLESERDGGEGKRKRDDEDASETVEFPPTKKVACMDGELEAQAILSRLGALLEDAKKTTWTADQQLQLGEFTFKLQAAARGMLS